MATVEVSSASSVVLDDAALQSVYVWVDGVPLSRPKRSIARDFSDGVLAAELLAHYFPKLVDMHNYSAANSIRQKLYNWATLNQKVLKRLGYEISKPDIEAIVACKPGVIEAILLQLQRKIAEYRSRKTAASEGSPGVDAAHDMRASTGSTGTRAMDAPSAPASSSAPVLAASASAIAEKDATIAELRETIEILELKVAKLEQLVWLKDSRIATLDARLRGAAAP